MSQIEIDIIISEIDPKHFEKHESGNVHLKLTAYPNTRGKNTHIIFIDNKFHGFANIIENYEVNNCVEVASIEELPF